MENKRDNNVGTSSGRKAWNLKEKEAEEMRKTANKYSVLSSLPDDDDQEIRILKDRIIVDQYLNKKLQPTPSESVNLVCRYEKIFQGEDCRGRSHG